MVDRVAATLMVKSNQPRTVVTGGDWYVDNGVNEGEVRQPPLPALRQAMKRLIAGVAYLACVVSADAAEPQKWCSTDGATITQVIDQSANGSTTSTYLLDGKPVSVSVEHGNWEEEGFVFIVYDDMIFAPCDAASADNAECDEF